METTASKIKPVIDAITKASKQLKISLPAQSGIFSGLVSTQSFAPYFTADAVVLGITSDKGYVLVAYHHYETADDFSSVRHRIDHRKIDIKFPIKDTKELVAKIKNAVRELKK